MWISLLLFQENVRQNKAKSDFDGFVDMWITDNSNKNKTLVINGLKRIMRYVDNLKILKS